LRGWIGGEERNGEAYAAAGTVAAATGAGAVAGAGATAGGGSAVAAHVWLLDSLVVGSK
jgi:hypothetical protein